jgi:hypothetical protein
MSATTEPTLVEEFTIHVEQVHDYEFKVRFDKLQFPERQLDEPGPLGRDTGPNAARVLSAAIGNCLSASLLFCAREAKVELSARFELKCGHRLRGMSAADCASSRLTCALTRP